MTDPEQPALDVSLRLDDRPLEETHPHLKEFFAYLPEANKESDRGLVLISVSYIDELLRRTLVAFFVDDKRHADLLDDANGPAASFSARTKLCHALGLLSEREVKELDRMRRIRNRFSHEVHVSFSDQQIASWCENLPFRAPAHIVQDARHQFATAAVALILNLTNRPHYVSLNRCKVQNWPT